ncbi:thermonuclease family protein [Mesorhizobium sp. CA18]|uniref:thermonuclease family protein n=1 Tax=unclassified Mesorhizobium TaxID=325217 RepID=UPI001CCD318C|nr:MULTISPECIES: thermonuclease family protein [unclassified Mesorhizobium]MBZ9734388.1 thermonuclease family protein [Mesorhizobium sp. CA9]MBZ9767107.1 thermonuclease family protein [Mesorhizobium sp. CA6]MBZ9824669.1 thermonuclease family protein [Mesorhizobium sp. CA18]MBZ9829373.1 thermonuclease family protein [Mesorhizobium sp. CA2]MBZ9837091.1 thermonuclease family protein [Mesorhizobium sp. CA3]
MNQVSPSGRPLLASALGGLGLLAGMVLIVEGGRLLPPASIAPAQDAGDLKPAFHGPIHDARPGRPARKIAEDLIAPPPLDPSGIERIEPRPPLSELGLAQRPQTPMPQDWRETLLFRPVATSSAVVEAMGRTVAISGTVDIGPDRTCMFDDTAWPCGQRARAAFNAWLRGRALKCFLSPDVDRFAIAAPCALGTQDVGAWLVSNGWAMAARNGIYGKAEVVARTARMGIFGPPQ